METVTARTRLGRTLAAALSLALSQLSLPAASAAEHLVDSGTLARRLLASAQTREQKITLFQQALDRPEVRQRAHSMGVSADKVSRALPHLSDAELADLTARAQGVKDVRAGHGSNDGMAILGIVLLLAAVVVLVAAAYDDGYYDDCYCY
jgi:hypothetical protein